MLPLAPHMRPAFLASLFLAAAAAAFSRPASADEACPVADIGKACAGGTCVAATCCDDPSGCAVPESDAGFSSGSSSSGAPPGGGTGTPRACAICTFVAGAYCLPSELGKPCGNGGTCEGQGGGVESLPSNAGTVSVSFDIQACTTDSIGGGDDAGAAGDAETFSGSTSGGGTTSSSTSSSGSGHGTGSSSGSASSGSSSSGGSSTGGGSGGRGSSGGGYGGGPKGSGATSGSGAESSGGCAVSPDGGSAFAGLLVGLAAIVGVRRRRA
jgi:MYXO-CTERM domain-containing protein